MAIESVITAPPALAVQPTIRKIHLADVWASLAEGWRDFVDTPTHLIFLALIYPVAGLFLARVAAGDDALPLVYPMVTGFALLGPLASVGLHEMSRRREQGLPVSARNAFDIFRSPRIVAIGMLGLALCIGFLVWLRVAQAIYDATMPADGITSVGGFLQSVLFTHDGHVLIAVGTGVGFLFALAVLMMGAFSFPLLVDRDIAPPGLEQAVAAVLTSMRAVLANPVPMLAFGAVVVIGLVIGWVTLLVGLAVTMPVLAHATWHLYRRVIA
jgi:uncharacterized membrane protein